MANSPPEKCSGVPLEQPLRGYQPGVPSTGANIPSYGSMVPMNSGLHIPTANLHRTMMPAMASVRGDSPQSRTGNGAPGGEREPYKPSTPNSVPPYSNNGSSSRPSPDSHQDSLTAKYQNDLSDASPTSSAGSFQNLLNMCSKFTSKNMMSQTHENLNQITKILADTSGEPAVDFRNSFSQSSRVVGPSITDRTSSPKMTGPGQSIPGTGHEGLASSKRAMYAGPTPASGNGSQPNKKKRKQTATATQSTATPSPPMPPHMMASYAQYAASLPPGMREMYMYPQYPYGANMGAGPPSKS